MNPLLHYEFGKQRGVFVSTWRTSNTSTGSSASNQIKLPLSASGFYFFKVDWGDGTTDAITVWNQAETTHTYSVAGDYTIKITGNCNGWRFANTGDRLKFLSVSTWGALRLGNATSYFNGCANLNLSAVSDILNLTGTFLLDRCFAGCNALTTINRITEWDTSLVTSMNNMFLQCFLYNQNIGALNVSNVIDFVSMFNNASIFNNGGSNSINNWVLKNSGSISMNSMFNSANGFNQPINLWNMSFVASIINFMNGKTAANYSTANLDAIYNGWTNRILNTALSISFSTIKRTVASTESRALLTRTNTTIAVSSVTNNGSGLIRVVVASAHSLTTGNKIFISGVLGTVEANGAWNITVIDAVTIDLQSSIFTNTYISGGILRTGYGWSVTDGGI